MIWILATRGASTKLRSSPYTETAIEGVHSIVYRAGIEPVFYGPWDGDIGIPGTFARGGHRIAGYVFSYDALVAHTLFWIETPVDLIVRYRANGQKRVRTFDDVIFVGDATVTVPNVNSGTSPLTGVPFHVQIPLDQRMSDFFTDEVDS